MCDTFYCAVGEAAGKGVSADIVFAGSFFGKNSDRQPDEPQTLCVVPRRPASGQVVLGGKTFPLSDAGLAFTLSKPSWMAGGEMGLNEKGVAIGNEAVFSRYKPAKDGVLGMDILRAALGASSTAKEAVDFICAFVEKYEQGGNGALKGSLYYDNSFIIADPSSAYILETAGHRWAWRSIPRRDAISNAYCIEEDYKRLDVATRKAISPVNERAACSDEADPGRKGEKESFKAYVENRFYLRFTRGEQRRALSLSMLGAFGTKLAQAAAPGTSTAPAAPAVLDFFNILRSHGPFDPAHPLARHMESLCVHSGVFPASATTASMVVEYRSPEAAVLWFTGTSYPCVSLYKPLLLVKGEFIPLWAGYDYAEGSAKAEDYWRRWKVWLAKSHNFLRSGDPAFVKGRDQAQESLAMIAHKALDDMAATGDLSSLPVLRQEAGAVIAGWEKDSGF